MLLSYCTNVHPAEDLDGVLEQLHRYAGPVRRRAGLDTLGVGLWLPAPLAHQLDQSPSDVARLAEALQVEGLQVHTLNAFPYGGFHNDVVKLDVYRPTWADPARLEYTMACARVLAALLPEGVDGSISTLPLGWREPWSQDDDNAAAAALAEASLRLRHLREQTGGTVRLAVEPEPGCVLDNMDDVVRWLSARMAEPREGSGDGSAGPRRPGTIDPEFVGICLDTCHLAVSFADPAATVESITAAGLRVVKVQASAALHVENPSGQEERAAVVPFAEPRYIHQVRERHDDGGVARADDLPDALADLPARGPWRIHFHIPLHHVPAAPLTATTGVLLDAVAAVRRAPHGDEAHLDVETYTWAVLPGGVPDLVDGIAAEVLWATEKLPATTSPTHLRASSTPLTHTPTEVAS